MKILDDFIREIRKFGITKASRLSGVPRDTIYAWVYGKNIPTLTKAQKVANAIGLEFLLFEKE